MARVLIRPPKLHAPAAAAGGGEGGGGDPGSGSGSGSRRGLWGDPGAGGIGSSEKTDLKKSMGGEREGADLEDCRERESVATGGGR